MRIVIINQARMSSTRLPGKVLKEVLGRPLLDYQIERLKRSTLTHELVVATTTNPADDVLVEYCRRRGIPVFRGPEQDVLARYYFAAAEHRAEAVVRVTADCPIIDSEVVDRVVSRFLSMAGGVDYVSNTQLRTYPRGMDTEVFAFDVLRRAHQEASLAYEREHVTPYLYRHPEVFRIEQVIHPVDLSMHRWTVDTTEDFELVRRIIEGLYQRNPRLGLADILAFVVANPSLMKINAHVVQKVLDE